MKSNLGKGTEIFQFFGEFYKFLSNFYVPENNEEYWNSLITESDALISKYVNCDFHILAKGLVLVVVNWLEIKCKNETDKKWAIMTIPKDCKVKVEKEDGSD